MWQTPKTDWEIKPYIDGRYQGDWFNVDDYNRIVGNLRYLHAAGQNVYDVVFDILGMSAADTEGFPHAGDINALEDSLYALTQNTYAPPDYTGKKTWAGNGSTPTVDDLNRIEQACLDLRAKYDETNMRRFVPYGADSLVTSDGYVFMTRSVAGLEADDYGFVAFAADETEDFGTVPEAATETEDWGLVA